MHKHTDEFSVILLLDEKTSARIKRLRDLLPYSPYRDDPPHVTLLQSIHTPHTMSDEELYAKLKPILNQLLRPKPHANVHKILNRAGKYYRTTSAIVLDTSGMLRREHISLLAVLRAGGFKVARHEMGFYYPHITIRLGVPLNNEATGLARELFPEGREADFSKWIIYRLASDKGKRLFYEVKPNG